MANFIESIFGAAPDYSSALSPEQMDQLKQNAALQGGIGSLVTLLGMSGAQPRPVSTGQALGAALGAGYGGYQNSFDNSLKQMLTAQQLGEYAKKQRQAQEIEQIKKSALTPQVSIAPGMSSADPFVAKMMEQNLAMGDTGLTSLARSGNFPFQGTSQEMTSPQTSTVFDPKKLISGLVNAGYIDEAKKYAPEYLTVGDSIYQKDPIKGLTPVINNQGKLTGEFGNYAKLFYGTDNVKDLPQGANQSIMGYVNKGKALEGGIGNLALGKEGANAVDKDLLALGRSRMSFQASMDQFKPEYLTRPYQLKMTALSETEKLNPSSLNDQQRSDLSNYSAFTKNAMSNLNEYINQVTGAAVGSGNEEKRLRAAIPDPQKDSPTEFVSKTNEALRLGKLFEVRLSYAKKNGLKITDVPVDNIPSIMRAREAELARDLKLDPTKPADRDALRTKLAQEFGLLN
jgi:hypothetical protein